MQDMFRVYPKRQAEREGDAPAEVPYAPNRAERRAREKHGRAMKRRGQRAYDRAQAKVIDAAKDMAPEEIEAAKRLAAKIKREVRD